MRHRSEGPAEPPAGAGQEEPFAFPTTRDEPAGQPATDGSASSGTRGAERGNMLPTRGRRRFGVERLLVRLVATIGVIGVGVALGAILTANHVAGWTIGLVIAVVTVVLSAILWSSRQL